MHNVDTLTSMHMETHRGVVKREHILMDFLILEMLHVFMSPIRNPLPPPHTRTQTRAQYIILVSFTGNTICVFEIYLLVFYKIILIWFMFCHLYSHILLSTFQLF